MITLKEQITHAAELLCTGKVVAFPTETVYGLGADATNEVAVKKIFQLKGRPTYNPLIIHVDNVSQVSEYVTITPRTRIAEQFERLLPLWPGPLTVVFPEKKSTISSAASAGLPSVGIRIPSHPLAQALLQQTNRPIAAPSANISEYVSATTAQHVRDCFGDAVYVLDGGPSTVGIESTIVQLSEDGPATVLRPGFITREALENHLMEELSTRTEHKATHQVMTSPGQLKKHYSPNTPLYMFEKAEAVSLVKQTLGRRIGMITISDGLEFDSAHIMTVPLSQSRDQNDYAKNLYAAIRTLDKAGLELIFIEKPTNGPLREALLDRLNRATHQYMERPVYASRRDESIPKSL